ncbi:DUF1294 domain-containing protein [Priestia koreensis]|nr:DUF1294 domain-containing protein [Priestia koreensis]
MKELFCFYEVKNVELVWIYLLVINLVGFFVMWTDKRRAIRHEWRIAEKTIWIVSIVFGALGTTIGMFACRHKTKHVQFKLGLPLLAIIDFILLVEWMSRTQ